MRRHQLLNPKLLTLIPNSFLFSFRKASSLYRKADTLPKNNQRRYVSHQACSKFIWKRPFHRVCVGGGQRERECIFCVCVGEKREVTCARVAEGVERCHKR